MAVVNGSGGVLGNVVSESCCHTCRLSAGLFKKAGGPWRDDWRSREGLCAVFRQTEHSHTQKYSINKTAS